MLHGSTIIAFCSNHINENNIALPETPATSSKHIHQGPSIIYNNRTKPLKP